MHCEGHEGTTSERLRHSTEIDLLELLLVPVRHKRMILSCGLGAAVLGTLFCLLCPPVYLSETKVLANGGKAAGVLQMLNMVGTPMENLGNVSLSDEGNLDLYSGLLETHAVLDSLIDEFHLVERFKADAREEARKELLDRLHNDLDRKSGILTIGVEIEDPQEAADISNAFVREMKVQLVRIEQHRAMEQRAFYETQLRAVELELLEAEEALRRFRERTGTVEIQEQAESLVEAIADLEARIAVREVEVRVMRTYAAAANPDLRRAEEELAGLREELAKLHIQRGDDAEGNRITAGRLPSLGTEYVRHRRQLAFQEKRYEVLLGHYEAARLEEARSIPSVHVIDVAQVPERRHAPRYGKVVPIALVLGLVVGFAYAFIAETAKRARNHPVHRANWRELSAQLRRF